MLTGLKRSHYYWLHCNCGVWLLWWFLTCNIWLDKGYFSAEVVHPSTHYLSFSKCIQLVTLQYIYTTVWGLHLFQLCLQVFGPASLAIKFSTCIQENLWAWRYFLWTLHWHNRWIYAHLHWLERKFEMRKANSGLNIFCQWKKCISCYVATTIRTGYGILLLSDIMKQNSGLSIRIVCSLHTYR